MTVLAIKDNFRSLVASRRIDLPSAIRMLRLKYMPHLKSSGILSKDNSLPIMLARVRHAKGIKASRSESAKTSGRSGMGYVRRFAETRHALSLQYGPISHIADDTVC